MKFSLVNYNMLLSFNRGKVSKSFIRANLSCRPQL